MEHSSRVLEETVGGCDPEWASVTLGKAADVVAGDFGSCFMVEDFEVDAIEASYAAFG